MDWVEKGTDWIQRRLAQVTDPNWLISHPGWAAILGLGVILIVGWFCLYKGGRGLYRLL